MQSQAPRRQRPVKEIRKLLRMSQEEMGRHIGCRQGNVSFYERGQEIPPAVARRLIELAASRGLQITFDHIYGAARLPVTAEG